MIKGIKICGVSNFETLEYIINHPYPPNFIGFIKVLKDLNFFDTVDQLVDYLEHPSKREKVLRRIWCDAISGDVKKIQLLAWLGCLD